jgi:predicted PurR-regulated permease PerM
MVVVAVTAIYLAAQQLYRRGIAALFRANVRPRVISTIDLVEETLRLWLLGQLVLMILVGVLTFIGLWLIGLLNPGALGLIAGLTEIIPYLGPFIGAIPALLVALTKGLVPALWTGGIYLGIHILEGYLVAPLIERRFVTIPPALVLLGITVSSLLFGVAGLVLAAPLTGVTYISVRTHYVENPLEQEPSA